MRVVDLCISAVHTRFDNGITVHFDCCATAADPGVDVVLGASRCRTRGLRPGSGRQRWHDTRALLAIRVHARRVPGEL